MKTGVEKGWFFWGQEGLTFALLKGIVNSKKYQP